MLLPITQNDYNPVIIVLTTFIGGWLFYECFQASKVLKYLKSEVEFNSIGFNVSWPDGIVNKYEWPRVGEMKHYAFAEVLVLRDRDGNRMLAIAEGAVNYKKFVNLAIEKTNLNY